MSYVDVAGLRTYYEVPGEGAPVVLLHGGLGGARTPPASPGPSSAGPRCAAAPHEPDWSALTGG
jgi:pimeloyl-ACP methyl ester carboxylesterase